MVDARCFADDRVADEHNISASRSIPDHRRKREISAVLESLVADRKARRRIGNGLGKVDLLKITALIAKRFEPVGLELLGDPIRGLLTAGLARTAAFHLRCAQGDRAVLDHLDGQAFADQIRSRACRGSRLRRNGQYGRKQKDCNGKDRGALSAK